MVTGVRKGRTSDAPLQLASYYCTSLNLILSLRSKQFHSSFSAELWMRIRRRKEHCKRTSLPERPVSTVTRKLSNQPTDGSTCAEYSCNKIRFGKIRTSIARTNESLNPLLNAQRSPLKPKAILVFLIKNACHII